MPSLDILDVNPFNFAQQTVHMAIRVHTSNRPKAPHHGGSNISSVPHQSPGSVFHFVGHGGPDAPFAGAEIAKMVLQSMAPSPPSADLVEDARVFSRIVNELLDAAARSLISSQDAHAIIGVLAEQFAARRVLSSMNGVTIHLPTLPGTSFAEF